MDPGVAVWKLKKGAEEGAPEAELLALLAEVEPTREPHWADTVQALRTAGLTAEADAWQERAVAAVDSGLSAVSLAQRAERAGAEDWCAAALDRARELAQTPYDHVAVAEAELTLLVDPEAAEARLLAWGPRLGEVSEVTGFITVFLEWDEGLPAVAATVRGQLGDALDDTDERVLRDTLSELAECFVESAKNVDEAVVLIKEILDEGADEEMRAALLRGLEKAHKRKPSDEGKAMLAALAE